MHNVAVWGFNNKSMNKCIQLLSEKKNIKIATWFGVNDLADYNMRNLFSGDFPKQKYSGNCRHAYKDVFDKVFYKYMDMMQRHWLYTNKNFHDYVNIYNMMYDFFAYIIVQKKIDIILFSNIPHEGPDIILYEIAKELKIKTIIFYQSLFPNKFFYVYNLDDFGDFEQIPEGKNPGVQIEKKYQKEIFYMGNKNNRYNLVLNKYSETLNRYTKKQLLKRGFSYTVVKTQNELKNIAYNNNLKNYAQNDIDLDTKFVYFPLHLQPELSTSGLGGIYVDQLLAIEHLSKVIPKEWNIYVKENPKQNQSMRGKWFFRRFNELDNAKLVSKNVDTYKLIENCEFVSTVTGTVGWEAITGGKNVLIFGSPWYQSLPGVFKYNDDFNLLDILNYKVNHEELNNKFNSLISKTEEGVIDSYYSTIVENYDEYENSLKVAESILKIINLDIFDCSC